MTCLPAEGTAVGLFSSWSRKTKAKQKEERKRLSVRRRQPAYSRCAALRPSSTHSFLPRVSAPRSLQRRRQEESLLAVLYGQGRTAAEQGGHKFSPSRWPSNGLSQVPTLLPWFL